MVIRLISIPGLANPVIIDGASNVEEFFLISYKKWCLNAMNADKTEKW